MALNDLVLSGAEENKVGAKVRGYIFSSKCMRAGNQLNIFNTLIEWVFHTASSTLEPAFIVFVHLFAEKTPRKDFRSGPKCEKLVSSLS